MFGWLLCPYFCPSHGYVLTLQAVPVLLSPAMSNALTASDLLLQPGYSPNQAGAEADTVYKMSSTPTGCITTAAASDRDPVSDAAWPHDLQTTSCCGGPSGGSGDQGAVGPGFTLKPRLRDSSSEHGIRHESIETVRFCTCPAR